MRGQLIFYKNEDNRKNVTCKIAKEYINRLPQKIGYWIIGWFEEPTVNVSFFSTKQQENRFE